jgi:hypothetical protein
MFINNAFARKLIHNNENILNDLAFPKKESSDQITITCVILIIK